MNLLQSRAQTFDAPQKGNEKIPAGHYVQLCFANDGVGISEQDLERIFPSFYTKKILGRSSTGLGLAAVWNTVHEHGGYLDFESGQHGTQFRLHFLPTSTQVETAKPECLDDYCGHGETILVVDDDDWQRDVSSFMLKQLGYDFHSVSMGEEAIEFLRFNPVELVVRDMIRERGIDGSFTYKSLRCPIRETSKFVNRSSVLGSTVKSL